MTFQVHTGEYVYTQTYMHTYKHTWTNIQKTHMHGHRHINAYTQENKHMYTHK